MTRPNLRFGVYLPPFGPLGEPGVLVDLARRAEAAGWDGVFLWDHVVTDQTPFVDTWTTLAAIAQATDRILLGPMVTPLPRRRPQVVARQASTVSRLCGGRLVLGAGAGTDETGDFSRFGDETDARARSAMLDEGLEVVRGLWSGERLAYEGRHYKAAADASRPEPHRIPVWIASSTNHPRVLRRAAAADGIFPNPDGRELGPDDVAGVVRGLRDAGLPAGRPFEVAVRGNASPAWDEGKDVDLAGLAAAGVTWWMESLFWLDPLELSLAVVDAGPPRP
ncbi:LLM class flavin-dependent oxidoreductase [Dactylosporangium sp. NPDC051484]|uniref:LLM class flavin-dependent oxidoreductase n=1 Tax=Dactylosporangium sp. NPDC051484 TaxID=3154942 RepID=UPI00344E69E3